MSAWDAPSDFVIVSRYMEPGQGWQKDELNVHATYEAAGAQASRVAHELDEKYGDEHFWTVDLYTPSREHGSYFQLFHGRLS